MPASSRMDDAHPYHPNESGSVFSDSLENFLNPKAFMMEEVALAGWCQSSQFSPHHRAFKVFLLSFSFRCRSYSLLYLVNALLSVAARCEWLIYLRTVGCAFYFTSATFPPHRSPSDRFALLPDNRSRSVQTRK